MSYLYPRVSHLFFQIQTFLPHLRLPHLYTIYETYFPNQQPLHLGLPSLPQAPKVPSYVLDEASHLPLNNHLTTIRSKASIARKKKMIFQCYHPFLTFLF